MAWVASHPAVTSPLLGARNVEQLDGCLEALEINMTEELRNAISALSPEPAPATDRNEETQSQKQKTLAAAKARLTVTDVG